MNQDLPPESFAPEMPIPNDPSPIPWWVGVGTAMGLILWPPLLSVPFSVPGLLISKNHPGWGNCLLVLGQAAMVLGAVAMARGAWKADWRRALPLARVSGGILLWTWLCTLGYLLVLAGWYSGLGHIMTLPNPLEGKTMGWPVLVLAFPIAEEIVFRGYGLARIQAQAGDRRALLWTAAAFALAHGYWVKLPDAFSVGLFCGWLVLRSGSLWPGILAHMTLNAPAGLVDHLPWLSSLESKQVPWSLVLTLFGAGVAILLVLFSRRVRGRVRELRASP